MADSNPIIVGGGIASGVPFTLGHLVYISNASPPQASTYEPIRALDGAVSYTGVPNSAGVYPSAAAATETFRINGGMIVNGAGTDSVQIGRGAVASASGNNQVVIGNGASSGVGGVGTVVIGPGAFGGAQGGVVIGNGANRTLVAGILIGESTTASGSGGGADVVVIGTGASIALGGSGTSGVVVGHTAASSHAGCVTIGEAARSSLVNGVGQGTVTIGDNATSNKASTTVLGAGSTTVQTNSVTLGNTATATNTAKSGSIVIGQLATSGGTDNIVIGRGSNNTSGNNSIVIGSGALDDIGSNFGQFGAPNSDVQTFLIGSGNTNAASAVRLIRFTNGSGLNNAPGNASLQAPIATGNALPPTLSILIGQQVAGSSSVLQTIGNAITWSHTTAGGHTTAIPNALTVGGTLAVTGIVTATSGISLTGGVISPGTIVRTANQGIAISAVTGGAFDFSVMNTAGTYAFMIPTGTSNVQFNGLVITAGGPTLLTTVSALTNGAGASAGTISNAPSIGNPTKWVGINDNGTIRYIPAW